MPKIVQINPCVLELLRDKVVTFFGGHSVVAHEKQIITGSRPSDHYFRSVCLSVCLFVQSFSQACLIRFRSNLDICCMSGS